MNTALIDPRPDLDRLIQRLTELKASLSRKILGKDKLIESLLLALLAEGSVLLEDVPGVGKTTLAKAFAAGTALEFRRVQCTPDLLPADVLGFSVFRPDTGEFRFQPGPIFCNLLLLDEINRASPRTQSALLEAMAERQVTIEGVRRELAVPFLVVATQNPCGYEGTFPMPESQLDRFLFKLPVNYPDPESEVSMLLGHVGQDAHELDGPLLQIEDICQLQSLVKSIHVADSVARYIVELASRTRHDPRVLLGASPRGALMLLRASQARAMLNGRDYVNPDDIQALAPDVLAHRLVLLQETRNDPAEQGMDAAARRIIVRLLQQLPIPN